MLHSLYNELQQFTNFRFYLGSFELLIFMFTLAGLAITVYSLIDIARRPGGLNSSLGLSRLVWAGVVLFIGFVGPIVYLVVGRKQLDADQRKWDLEQQVATAPERETAAW